MLTDGGALILASTALEILSDRIDALGVEVMRDTTVAEIDVERKLVVTEAGETVEYDKIILSCGPWTNQVGTLRPAPVNDSSRGPAFHTQRAAAFCVADAGQGWPLAAADRGQLRAGRVLPAQARQALPGRRPRARRFPGDHLLPRGELHATHSQGVFLCVDCRLADGLVRRTTLTPSRTCPAASRA